MRGLTVVWTDSDDAGDVPVRITQLRASWEPGESTTQLLLQACAEHPEFEPEQMSRIGLDMQGRVLAIFEGWAMPLYVAEGIEV